MFEHPYTVLVTGGAGFIGSHACIALQEAGHHVVIYDNLSTSHPLVIERIGEITGRVPIFVQGDIQDRARLEATLAACHCNAVMHFAGLKSVSESVDQPLSYYENNVMGSLVLLQAMASIGVRTLVFSSSATVYGIPQELPLKEDHPLSATTPYGRTKIIVEEMLREHFNTCPDWRIAILRYFNPVGAHESGLIGEDPQGKPNNLMPLISQVASGKRPHLNVWGNDYPTPDGTGIRDYIHVLDLVQGHVSALNHLNDPQCIEVNLGTGRGHSVLEMVRAFERISGQTIPLERAPRRDGDVSSCYADPQRALDLLDWRAQRDIDEMCRDAWNWQVSNPYGYSKKDEHSVAQLLAGEACAPDSLVEFITPERASSPLGFQSV